MLVRVKPSPRHVLETPLAGDGLGRLEARAGIRDEPDAREDLMLLDHELIGAVDPLHPRRAMAEGGVDAGRPQVGRLEDVRIGREDEGGHAWAVPFCFPLSLDAIVARSQVLPGEVPTRPSLTVAAPPAQYRVAGSGVVGPARSRGVAGDENPEEGMAR